MKITKEFLQMRIAMTEEICTAYSRRSLVDGIPADGTIRYSRLPSDVQGLALSSYITFRSLKPPALRKENMQRFYAEYLFSDDLLLRKILSYDKGQQECYYVYENERHIRLTYQGNSFKELHCVCYDNGALTEVFTAFFTNDTLSHLSGETYESKDGRIISAEAYRNFMPSLPAFLNRKVQEIPIVINPSISSFLFDYDTNIVRTANPKDLACGKELPKVLLEYANGKPIDCYLLW